MCGHASIWSNSIREWLTQTEDLFVAHTQTFAPLCRYRIRVHIPFMVCVSCHKFIFQHHQLIARPPCRRVISRLHMLTRRERKRERAQSSITLLLFKRIFLRFMQSPGMQFDFDGSKNMFHTNLCRQKPTTQMQMNIHNWPCGIVWQSFCRNPRSCMSHRSTTQPNE